MPPFLWLLLLPVPFPQALALADDPAPGLFRTKAQARALECEVLTTAQAQARLPGRVADPPPRGSFTDTNAMVCHAPLFAPDERDPRDEAILSTLDGTSAELAQASVAASPAGLTWHVDSFYPDVRIGSKLTFAAKVALVARGQRVSDTVPTLAAGDLEVLGNRPPLEAYPLACARLQAEGSLPEGHALLGVVLVDSRETSLHAGVCRDGKWRWVQ